MRSMQIPAKSDLAARFRRSAKALAGLTHKQSLPLALSESNLPPLALDSAGNVIDLTFNGARFYGGDARKMSEGQADDYYRQNVQFDRSYIALVKDDELLYGFGRSVDAESDQPWMLQPQLSGLGANYAAPKDYCGSLVVFGLGLGYHIPHLIKLYRPLRIVIFEAFAELWAASAAALDWEALRDRCRRDSIELIAFFHTDPEYAPSAVIEATKRGSGAMSCFVRSYLHHTEPFNKRVADRFAELKSFLAAGDGYFVDEMRQIAQTARNLESSRVISAAPEPAVAAGSCAIVVGSGPSLDKSWGIIRRFRGDAHVISCGTALKALLSKGVTPDFHVELETHPLVSQVYEQMGLRGLVDGVTLFCSSGTPRDAMDFFRSSVLFFRYLNASSALAEGIFPTIPWAYGRVGAAGAALAAFLGFETIVMVGMDFGYAPDSPDHAAGTIYEEDGGAKIIDDTFAGSETLAPDAQRRIKSERISAEIPVPAVTGKTVMVDQTFIQAIAAAAHLAMSRPDTRLFQVSEGASIKHARNITPDEFNRLTFNFRRAAEVDRFVAGCTHRDDLSTAFLARMKKQNRDFEALCNEMKSYYARPFSGLKGFARLDRDAVRRLDTHWLAHHRPTAGLIWGTLIGLGKLTIQRAIMHPDEESRQEFLMTARKHILATIDEAAQSLTRTYQAVSDHRPA